MYYSIDLKHIASVLKFTAIRTWLVEKKLDDHDIFVLYTILRQRLCIFKGHVGEYKEIITEF